MVKQQMFQKNLILVVTLLSLSVFQSSAVAASGLIGSAAPYFSVGSGDDKVLKDELNKLYYQQTDALKDVLVRLPIIDCSDAIWPFQRIWKRRLREHSKKEGMAIYCDWNGQVSSDYEMKADVINVVIIDKGGKIRFFTSGEGTAEQINELKELLKVLV